MWYRDLDKDASWASLWSGYILCWTCLGIRRLEGPCPSCKAPLPIGQRTEARPDDGRPPIVTTTFMGAEGRYEDYVYLQMLQREWERPAPEFERFAHFPECERPSARAALVLLFWSYFETRIERLLRGAMQALPESVSDELLERYSSVGTRLNRLYRIILGSTYFDDLTTLGYVRVATLLTELHKRRNAFTHGRPQAIDDATVVALVNALKEEHEAWIAAFNFRATRRSAQNLSAPDR